MTSNRKNAPLSTDLDDPSAVPYFLWDEPMTVAELRARLGTASPPERTRLLGKILREARDTDVWRFTSPSEVSRLWPELSPDLGATSEEILTTPDFRRRLLRRDRESVIVDLVRERVSQMFPDKPVIAGIRVDPAEEIMANKLCTLLARAEVRDLVDLRALEGAGLSLRDALNAGARKDRGLTPAQLAWVLSEIRIGDDAQIPGGVAVSDLQEYLHN